MGLSAFLRGAGRGAASVGRAVQQASQKLDSAVAGTPMPVPQVPVTPQAGAPQAPLPTAEPGAGPGAAGSLSPPTHTQEPAKPRGFQLPMLGAAPDQNDPKYQGEGGKERLARDAEDFEHKQHIHDAFAQLETVYAQAHPGRDFQKEYEEGVASQKEMEAARPKGNNLARAALALGDFNPALQQAGKSNLADYNQNVDKEAAASDKGFSQRMMLRKNMHEQQAAEAEAAGNFKKALKERETLALLDADEASLKHSRDLEKEKVKQEAAGSRAKIRADAMEKVANTRAKIISDSHGLSGSFLKQFEKEAAKAVARLLGPRDLTKEYEPADLDRVTDFVEQLAEHFHDLQYGDGSADTYVGKHPDKKPQPKATGKEQF